MKAFGAKSRLLFLLFALLPVFSAYASAADEAALRRKKSEFEKQGEIRDWPERSWTRAFTARSRYYTVKSNTSYNIAKYICDLMEMTAEKYREIFGAEHARIPNLTVHAYRSREEFVAEALKLGVNAGNYGGFYLPQGPGAIHIPYVQAGVHPSLILFHEGTHQFVHHAIDFKLPYALKAGLPEKFHSLGSVPIWLNEGLATYMETAYFNGEELEIGRVNPSRLSQLQMMLRQKTAPSVREVLERRYGQPFGAEHYAVAWGIIFYLRHDYRVEERDARRKALIGYIESCKRGMMPVPSRDFKTLFMKDGKILQTFPLDWRVYIGKRSREEFERIIVGRQSTLAEWEKEWIARILKLNPNQPYGGTNRGEAVENKGKEKLY